MQDNRDMGSYKFVSFLLLFTFANCYVTDLEELTLTKLDAMLKEYFKFQLEYFAEFENLQNCTFNELLNCTDDDSTRIKQTINRYLITKQLDLDPSVSLDDILHYELKRGNQSPLNRKKYSLLDFLSIALKRRQSKFVTEKNSPIVSRSDDNVETGTGIPNGVDIRNTVLPINPLHLKTSTFDKDHSSTVVTVAFEPASESYVENEDALQLEPLFLDFPSKDDFILAEDVNEPCEADSLLDVEGILLASNHREPLIEDIHVEGLPLSLIAGRREVELEDMECDDFVFDMVDSVSPINAEVLFFEEPVQELEIFLDDLDSDTIILQDRLNKRDDIMTKSMKAEADLKDDTNVDDDTDFNSIDSLESNDALAYEFPPVTAVDHSIEFVEPNDNMPLDLDMEIAYVVNEVTGSPRSEFSTTKVKNELLNLAIRDQSARADTVIEESNNGAITVPAVSEIVNLQLAAK